MNEADSTRCSDSRLGATASRITRKGTSLRFDDERHLEMHRWLVDETYLLDAQAYTEWLDHLADDIHYLMPVRVTTSARHARLDTAPGMAHFDEDKYSLSRRAARFLTEHAWTEDRCCGYAIICPTCARSQPRTPTTSSSTRHLLLFRSRGDVREAAL